MFVCLFIFFFFFFWYGHDNTKSMYLSFFFHQNIHEMIYFFSFLFLFSAWIHLICSFSLIPYVFCYSNKNLFVILFLDYACFALFLCVSVCFPKYFQNACISFHWLEQTNRKKIINYWQLRLDFVVFVVDVAVSIVLFFESPELESIEWKM